MTILEYKLQKEEQTFVPRAFKLIRKLWLFPLWHLPMQMVVLSPLVYLIRLGR